MIEYDKFDLYMEESVDKQLQIAFDGGTITNKEIPSEQFSLTESLSSDGLMFGSCEASEVKFRIYNVFTPLKDKWLTITQVLDKDFENPLQIGKYKVYSDKPTADRSYRDVIAYDSMYDIINADVASWYNSLTFPMQLKTFRDSFFDYFGIDQEEVALVNDAMTVEKTIEPSVLSGKDVLQSICQINGCFGHIGRDGKMQYVFLNAIMGGLYPSNNIYPADDLYPMQPNINVLSKGLYVEPPTYEDYTVKPIDKLEIREKEGDIGVIVGSGNNAYFVEDNFLVYGKSTDDLTVIANNMLSVIDGLEYRPFDARLVGNPCFEVGDMVRLNTKHQIIDSYVLQRTLSGVQCLRDDFSAEGEEYQSEKVNDIQTEIKQLKGKSNTLERTIEETRSTIANMEEGLQSEISQTAESITMEVSKQITETREYVDEVAQAVIDGANKSTDEKLKSYSTTTEVEAKILQSADSINLSVEEKVTEVKDYTDEALEDYSTTEEMNAAITLSGQGITQEVSKTYETKTNAGATKTELLSIISQTAESIRLEVAEETNELSSQIEQTQSYIVLGVNSQGKMVLVELSADRNTGTAFTVSADNIDLSAEEVINLLSNGNINLSGKNISIDSNNFSVDSQGNMKCNNADVTGIVNATKLSATGSLNIADGNLTYDDVNGLVVKGLSAYDGVSVTDYLEIIDGTLIFYLVSPVTSDTYLRIYTGSDLEVPEDYLYIDKALRTKGNITSENHVISKGVMMTSHSRPRQNKVGQCGLDSYRWEQIWGADGEITTSDRNEKHDINPLSEKYEDLFNRLKPITYVFNDRIRTHVGFVSQDVEQALIDSEIDSKDFAGFCKGVKSEVQTIDGDEVEVPIVDKDGNTTPTYSLRYSEFIALNTHMIQKAYKKIETQQQEIEELKKSVSFLMSKLGDDSNG